MFESGDYEKDDTDGVQPRSAVNLISGGRNG
jgi:hypothetical protein